LVAVGDAGWEGECLGKMGEVATKTCGRTVFFREPQHGEPVRALCERHPDENGRATLNGSPPEVIQPLPRLTAVPWQRESPANSMNWPAPMHRRESAVSSSLRLLGSGGLDALTTFQSPISQSQ